MTALQAVVLAKSPTEIAAQAEKSRGTEVVAVSLQLLVKATYVQATPLAYFWMLVH
jgi:hypothetical protein